MQFATLLKITAFIIGLAAAAPYAIEERQTTTLPALKVSDALAQLEANNQVNWTDVAGGRLTFVSHEQGLSALDTTSTRRDTSSLLIARKKPKWQPAGEIDGYEAEEQCFNSGVSVLTNLVSAHFGDACKAFFGATQVGVTINSGWHIFQASGLAALSGANAAINYRWQNGGTATELVPTEALCNLAAQELMTGPCASTGQTSGGNIEVAKALGWVLGYDPVKV